MIVKAESMEYPDFGFEKKMTKTDNSNTLICRYIDGIIPHHYSSDLALVGGGTFSQPEVISFGLIPSLYNWFQCQ